MLILDFFLKKEIKFRIKRPQIGVSIVRYTKTTNMDTSSRAQAGT